MKRIVWMVLVLGLSLGVSAAAGKKGDTFPPKVFKTGTYPVEVDGKTFPGLEARILNDPFVIDVLL